MNLMVLMKWNRLKLFGVVHIAEREDEEHKILLYQVEPFYVEVYLHKVFNVIRKFQYPISLNRTIAAIFV